MIFCKSWRKGSGFKSHLNLTQLLLSSWYPPSLRHSVRDSWDVSVYSRGTLTHFAAPATLRPPYVISEHTFDKSTFRGASFYFLGQPGFVETGAAAAVFWIFFTRNQTSSKQKVTAIKSWERTRVAFLSLFWPGFRYTAVWKSETVKQLHQQNRAKKGLKMRHAFSTNFWSCALFVLTAFDFGWKKLKKQLLRRRFQQIQVLGPTFR